MRKLALLIIVLVSTGCGSTIPVAPDGWQCAFGVKQQAFYCVHSKTGEKQKRETTDPRMHGSQVFELDYYNAYMKWIDDLIKLARKHCS